MQSNNSLRIACDGESASGKSLAAKLISHKYKPMFCMNSGLLFRYASYLIIKYKPKKIGKDKEMGPIRRKLKGLFE